MKIAVIGGGPAGMSAAYFAARGGADVTLYEQNEKTGKKLYITGKGRCNLTNNCEVSEFLQNIPVNSRFLYGALNRFSPRDAMDLFAAEGVRLKTERGGRVFPESDKASDITRALEKMLRRNGVKIVLNTEIKKVVYRDNAFVLITITDIVCYDKVIIATGGLSYPSTGSRGDGYRFAKELGHSIITPKAALCQLNVGKEAEALEGLSLKNVTVSLKSSDGKVLDGEFGEMLFTSDGLSGPAVIKLSSRVNKFSPEGLFLSVDLKPALDYEKLDARILRDFGDNINRNFANALYGLLPEKMCGYIVARSGIAANKKVNRVTAEERARLVRMLKDLRFTYKGTDEIQRAIVTSGGINVKEINPSAMESKIVKGLYFAGEVIDVDGYTGGFNIQIALSTGYVAGTSAAEQ